MQSTLHARSAKSFAVKNIGEQLREYMNWRGWKARQMAEHIQRYPGGASVKRQHIQSLLGGEVGLPRYIEALARSMGVTADDLLKGRYDPPKEPPTSGYSRSDETRPAPVAEESEPERYAGAVKGTIPLSRSTPLTVRNAVVVLREAMANVDEDIRAAVLSQLTSMSKRISEDAYGEYVADNIARQLSPPQTTAQADTAKKAG